MRSLRPLWQSLALDEPGSCVVRTQKRSYPHLHCKLFIPRGSCLSRIRRIYWVHRRRKHLQLAPSSLMDWRLSLRWYHHCSLPRLLRPRLNSILIFTSHQIYHALFFHSRLRHLLRPLLLHPLPLQPVLNQHPRLFPHLVLLLSPLRQSKHLPNRLHHHHHHHHRHPLADPVLVHRYPTAMYRSRTNQ